jgi:hypothetical protein
VICTAVMDGELLELVARGAIKLENDGYVNFMLTPSSPIG